MARQTQQFIVERTVNNETVEYELVAECEITEEVGYIDGPVCTIDNDGQHVPWDGALTEDEETQVGSDAYDAWMENVSDFDEDAEEVGELNDFFHDDRAIEIAGKGIVSY